MTDTTSTPSPADAVEGVSGRRAGLVYVGMVVAGLVLLEVVLRLGHGVHGPHPSSVAGPKGGTGSEDLTWRLLVASAVIIIVARAVGAAFQRINQPQVVGEIVAGLLLGPSVLGALAPGASAALFPQNLLPFIDVFSQVGLVFFMFLIGLELDPKLIRGRGHAAATVSHVSIILPFLLGTGLALYLFPTLGSESGRFVPFALFLGASMSITAFPVLARILTERGIYKTPLGTVALTCAAVDDVTAWCLLAVVVAIARAKGTQAAVVTIVLAVAFIAFMIIAVRPAVSRLARYHEELGHLGGGMLAILFIGIVLSAVATDRIGIHAIFGAFLFGAIMPQRSEFVGEVVGKLEDFTVVFLLPLFFAFTGLRTNIGLLGSSPTLWLVCALVLIVAVLGKWGGSSFAARVLGLPWRESMALGVLMNTRGLTELIILNIGLDLKVIPPALFAILVIMALVTTFMTTPLLSAFYPRSELDRMVAEAEEEDEGPRRFTVLVPVPKTAAAGELIHTAMQLVRESEERATVILLRAVTPPGSAYRAGPRVQESLLRRATASLKPFVALVEGAGHEAIPVVTPTRRMSDAIVSVAKQRQPDLVLMAYQRPMWGTRFLRGVVGDVLRRAPADVAIVVDATSRGLGLRRGAHIVVPHGGGFHEDVGLDLALRLAEATGATLSVVGPGVDDKSARELAERANRAYEQRGVWTIPEDVQGEPWPVLVERAQSADLIVLGVADEWNQRKDTLGGLREALAAHAARPIIIVRRRGKQSLLRRQKEWITAGPGDDVEAAATGARQVADHLT